VDLDQERVADLLDDLAKHHKVQNIGRRNQHDWVPLATDYPDLF
jgi:predicted oxidoreductase